MIRIFVKLLNAVLQHRRCVEDSMTRDFAHLREISLRSRRMLK